MNNSFSVICIIIEGIVIQFIEVEKLCQRHVERQRHFVQSFHARILGQTTHDIVKRGLLHVTHRRELVDCNAALLAEAADSLDIQFRIVHTIALAHIITRLWVIMMIAMDGVILTRIRVDI